MNTHFNTHHGFSRRFVNKAASLIAQLVKKPTAMQETLFNSYVRKICWRRDRLLTPVFLGFPVAQLVRNLPGMRETWVDPWVGKIPWRRERLLTPVFWPVRLQRVGGLRDFHFVNNGDRITISCSIQKVPFREGTVYCYDFHWKRDFFEPISSWAIPLIITFAPSIVNFSKAVSMPHLLCSLWPMKLGFCSRHLIIVFLSITTFISLRAHLSLSASFDVVDSSILFETVLYIITGDTTVSWVFFFF